jgi:hypothetical protein
MLIRSQQIVFALAICTYVNLSFSVSLGEAKGLQSHGWAVQPFLYTAKPSKPLLLVCDLNADINSDFPYEVIFSIHYPQPQKNGRPTNLAALDKVTLEIKNDIRAKNIGICVAHVTGLGCRDMVCYMTSRESSKNVSLTMPEGFKVSFKSRRDLNWSVWKHYKARIED